jgi:hypothetical protein
MLAELQRHDFVIGTRYGESFDVDKSWPWYRVVISKGARLLARSLTSFPMPCLPPHAHTHTHTSILFLHLSALQGTKGKEAAEARVQCGKLFWRHRRFQGVYGMRELVASSTAPCCGIRIGRCSRYHKSFRSSQTTIERFLSSQTWYRMFAIPQELSIVANDDRTLSIVANEAGSRARCRTCYRISAKASSSNHRMIEGTNANAMGC